jgi:hypothetical protein
MLVGAIAICTALVSGCVSVPKRNPVPEDKIDSMGFLVGREGAAAWGDETPHYVDSWFSMTEEQIRERHAGVIGKPHHYLAISGGGADGAFGAGVLCGWTAAGTRPEFTDVTGISTGALIAPFAFLGPDYDDELREFYTTVTTKEIIKKRSVLNMITSDAAASSKPLQGLLERVIDEEMVGKIAAENRKGRALIVATTWLDAQRPVHWNLGEIAESDHPRAIELIRQVLLASASIPGAFPPVLIDVEIDGEIYDAMHVDGGAAAQVFLYPAGLDWGHVLEMLDIPELPAVYVIRNSRVHPDFQSVKNRIFPIVGRSVSSLIRTQGIGNMYELYLLAERDGLDYHLAHIPQKFEHDRTEQFDPEYMKALFDLGFEMAENGYPWEKVPPGYFTKTEQED